MRIFKSLTLTTLAAGCLLTPTFAFAESAQPVSMTGLDLATPAGHAQAIKRIEKAARNLCRNVPVEGVGRQDDWLKFQDCVKQASDAAAAKLPDAAKTAG